MAKNVFAGIDEAGRGAVIGPLVIAGVSVKKEDEAKLKALGLKDSKDLSPKRREVLAKEIEKLAEDIVVIKMSACKIDNMRAGGTNLNQLEAMKFGDILNLLEPGKTYIDCPDVKPERLKLQLEKMFSGGELVVEHKADSTYPVVSAASIMAKVTRDREVKQLHKEFGDFGPGYSSNEKTIDWMRNWIETNRDWPDIVRKGWSTSREIKNEKSQKGISGFFKKLRTKEDCKPQMRDLHGVGNE